MRELADDVIGVPLNGFMMLRSVRVRYFDYHLFLLENDTVAKHFHRQIFVEVGIHALRILAPAAVGDVCRAI